MTLARKALTTLSAGALVAGLSVAAPTSASANPLIIAPAAAAAWLIGGIVGGLFVGDAIASNGHPFVVAASEPVPPPPPPVVAAPVDQPAPGCYFSRARIHGMWHRVQICD
jgi:hypothetical protein